MGKIIETKVNSFFGGISDDVREVAPNKFSISKHFDISSNPKKLIPYRSVEDESPAAGNAIGNMIFTSQGDIVGLGVVIANSQPALWYKANGATIITDAWTTPVARQGSEGVLNDACYKILVEFNGVIYFAEYVNPSYKLSKGNVDFTSGNLTEGFATLSGAPTGNALVHPSANILFIPCGNKIDKINSAGTFSANQAPSISSNLEITSLALYGSYLAIGCRDKAGGNSKVIIWDMVSTTTFIDTLDWGKEALYVLNNLEGVLIGISCTPSTVFIGDFARLTVQSWGGGKVELVKEVYADKLVSGTPTVSIYPRVNFILNNRLWFSAKISGGTSPSPTHTGLFSVGRKNSNYPFSLTFERFATNDNSETSIISALIVKDYCWTVHTANGTVTRTNDQQVYNAISTYESQKFNGEIHGFDSSFTKKLLGVSVQHDKLPTDGVITMYYRCDGATSWTAIFQNTTADTLSYEAVNADTDLDGTPDANLPQYKEIEFKITSTCGSGTSTSGGAAITGFSFREELIDKRLY